MIETGLIGFGAFFVLVSLSSYATGQSQSSSTLVAFYSKLANSAWQMPAQLYLVGLFGSQAAASALGASNLLRFLSSTFLPLAGPAMYETLGYGWGDTLLGFLALAFVPFPVLFYKHGERLRAKPVEL